MKTAHTHTNKCFSFSFVSFLSLLWDCCFESHSFKISITIRVWMWVCMCHLTISLFYRYFVEWNFVSLLLFHLFIYLFLCFHMLKLEHKSTRYDFRDSCLIVCLYSHNVLCWTALNPFNLPIEQKKKKKKEQQKYINLPWLHFKDSIVVIVINVFTHKIYWFRFHCGHSNPLCVSSFFLSFVVSCVFSSFQITYTPSGGSWSVCMWLCE